MNEQKVEYLLLSYKYCNGWVQSRTKGDHGCAFNAQLIDDALPPISGTVDLNLLSHKTDGM